MIILCSLLMFFFDHIKAWQDHAADVVNIKISKFGGITRAKEAIEFCTNVGLAMTIEDTWGGELHRC